MTNALNIVILEGRVVRTPDLLYTKSGHAMCKFEVAYDETYICGDFEKKITTFVTINLWDKPAENLTKYLEKGKAIRVTGSLKQNNWEDKNGIRHNDLYINATNIDFLDWVDEKDD